VRLTSQVGPFVSDSLLDPVLVETDQAVGVQRTEIGVFVEGILGTVDDLKG
jgi:hypothetical protein